MVAYKIKRGLAANLQGTTFEAYEPAYTIDTNELYVADANGLAVKVADHIVVEALPAVEVAVKGKFYVVSDGNNGAVNYFDGTKFIPLSPDLSNITGALSSVQSALVGIQSDIQQLQTNLAAHEVDADAKYATKTEIADLVDGAYVDGKITDLINAAPEALDTLGEIATKLQEESDAAVIVKTLAEANRDAIATKAEQTDLDGAVDRIVALENKPSVTGTNVVVGDEVMAGDITFQATGEAKISVDAQAKVVTINVPEITELDGGTF